MNFVCLKLEFLAMCAVIVLLMLLLESCVHEPLVGPVDGTNKSEPVVDEQCAPDIVYFENEILPLLVSNCTKSGCHDAATAENGIVLNSYASVMSSDLIESGNPEKSVLYKVITEDDADGAMPPFPSYPLESDQVQKIGTWITQGAKNNKCNSMACDRTNVTYSASIHPLITAKCKGCHSGDPPSGNLDLTQHQALQTIALDGRLTGAVTHAPGFSPMPQGGSKLSDCEIEMIGIWVTQGARNN
jgi:hypothetical protein